MSSNDIWTNYTEKAVLSNGIFGQIYKGIDKTTGNYVAIKEINKLKYKKLSGTPFKEEEILPKINLESNTTLKTTVNTEKNFYIIMQLSICNLEDFLLMRDTPLSINEIKEMLIQLNENFKVIQRENIIIKDLKLSNFLIFLEKANQIKYKLSDFDSSKFSDKTKVNSMNLEETPLTLAPEVLNNESISNKSDIWSLGTIIYYLYFKEYPFNGETEEDILNEIDSNKQLKEIANKDLNDLVSKMLIKDENERISWHDYFNHPFFKKNIVKENIINLPQFDFLCKKHSKDYHSYCFNCKCNLCENCLNEHKSHKIIYFSKIGLTNVEANLIKSLINELEENLNNFTKMKNDIKNLFNKMELINDNSNSSIFFDDTINNYKEFYIECLNAMNDKIKKLEKIKIIDIEEKKPEKEENKKEENKNEEKKEIKKEDKKENKTEEKKETSTQEIKNESNDNNINNIIAKVKTKKFRGRKFPFKKPTPKPKKEEKKKEIIETYSQDNFIICEYEIKEIDEPVQILNCFEEASCSNEGLENENELRENCELHLNDKIIDFTFKYQFPKEGKYIIKIICKKPLKTTNYMFCECSTLISLDLSNFNTENVTNMNSMFRECSNLTFLNLQNFNTSKVTNMSHMFRKCSSLIFLNLSNFNTENVTNMSYMFRECSSLTNLNLSKFNTEKVTNMSYMFLECTSLTNLNVSSFNTKNVSSMESLFFKCSSLQNLDLSNFNTEKIQNMSWMFSDCSSLLSLNLKNFITDNVVNMGSMFSHCSSLKTLDLSNFITKNVKNMSWMFSHCDSMENLDLSNFEIDPSNDVNFMFSSMNKLCYIICKDPKLNELSKNY